MSAKDTIARCRELMSVRQALLADIEDAVAQRDALAFLKLRAELERLDGVEPGAYKHGIPKRPGDRPKRPAKGGASRLEDRIDWEFKVVAVRRIEQQLATGVTLERACELEATTPRTYQRWRQRLKSGANN